MGRRRKGRREGWYRRGRQVRGEEWEKTGGKEV